MRRTLTILAGCLVFLMSLGSVQVPAVEFPTMLRRVPEDVNVLVCVDVDGLLATPMAAEQNWKAKVGQQAALKPVLLPPTAHKLVRAMSVDLGSQSPAFEITLLEMPGGNTLKKIAERHKGYVEAIAGTETAWFPQGAYCVKLAEDQYGVLFPANRQFLSRWLREKNGQASMYLSNAAREVKPKGPQIMLAIDLDDAIGPGSLVDRIPSTAALSGAKDLPTITKVLEGVRGAKFAVTVEKTAKVNLVVNFDLDVAPLLPVAKPLLLEIMNNRGLALDEADDWKVTSSGRQLIFTGDLTDSGLMRLSSLFELPSDLIEDPEKDVDASNPALYATQAHYKSVQRLVDDLFAKKKQSFGQYAQWAEQYAQKIDRLPLLNVDKEMQAYSARVANLLRQGAISFKGVGIRKGVRQANTPTGWYASYDYNGYRSVYDGNAAQIGIGAQERAVGATDAAEMKRQIDQESAAIRKVMVDRYKVEF